MEFFDEGDVLNSTSTIEDAAKTIGEDALIEDFYDQESTIM